MCRLHYYEALKLFSVFHIFPGYTSNVNIKRSIWYHLSSLVQLWFMYCIWSDLMLLILITDCVLYMLLFECVRTCNCFLLCCLCIFLSCAAFRCSAPSVWNSLPSFITNSNSLTTLKSRLKTYFYRVAFDCSIHVWSHHIPVSGIDMNGHTFTKQYQPISQPSEVICIVPPTKRRHRRLRVEIKSNRRSIKQLK